MDRDLTKSAISFSWALSLLGIKQALKLFRPGQQRNGDMLGPMAQAAVDQLDDSMKGIFRSGDNLQARAVDLAFASLNPINWINPGNWMRSIGNSGQQSATGTPGGQQSYANAGQGAGPQSYGGSTRGVEQQSYSQTGQGSATDAVLSWLSPLNWLNPNTWLGGGRSRESCGCGRGAAGTGQGMWQAGADVGQTMGQAIGQAGAAMGQAGTAMGQAMNQATAAFSGQQPQGTGGTAGDSRSANWGPPRVS